MKFTKICKKTQKELKRYLTNYLKSKYNNVTEMDGFVYAKGEFPVLLVAHMDTVHKQTVKQIVYKQNGNEVSSPQGIGGDDRCGVYMISKIIEDFNCSVVFTEDEEIGGIGARKFVQAISTGDVDCTGINYIIELDRKGRKDAVFYECDNPDFEKFITKDNDWKFNYGSYSDIVDIAPEIGVAAVNLSCGYYNAHTVSEYVMLDEMEENIEKVKRLLARTTEKDYFEFIEATYSYYKGYNSWGNSAKGWYYEDEYGEKTYYICAQTRGGHYIEEEICAISKEEAVGQFLIWNSDLRYNDILQVLCEDDFN